MRPTLLMTPRARVSSGPYTWKTGFSVHRHGTRETRDGPRLRLAVPEARRRRSPARLHPFPPCLTYPGLPFQLSVQIGALELLDYLSNNERQIRLLLQHFPCPSPPKQRGQAASAKRTGYGVPLRPSDTSPGAYYAGTPPAGVTRQLPGFVSVHLWFPPRLEGPAPAFRLRKTTWGVAFGCIVLAYSVIERQEEELFPPGPQHLKRGTQRVVFVFFKGSLLFHLSISAETGLCT